ARGTEPGTTLCLSGGRRTQSSSAFAGRDLGLTPLTAQSRYLLSRFADPLNQFSYQFHQSWGILCSRLTRLGPNRCRPPSTRLSGLPAPKSPTGSIRDAPGETWLAVAHAMNSGMRGLPGGTSLARFLTKHRNVRNHL